MSLPEEFSRKLENVDVVIEEEPSEDVLRELGLSRGSLLGLYHGVPLRRKSVWTPPILPGKISIYRKPIVSVSRTREEMRQRIRQVVIHEIGHHFGLTDQDMRPSEQRPAGGKRARLRIKKLVKGHGRKQP